MNSLLSNPLIQNIIYSVDFELGQIKKYKSLAETPVDDHSFTLIDVSIKSRGADEVIYSAHRNIWENVPRGLNFILQNGKLVSTLCGVRKFGNPEDTGLESPLQEKEVDTVEYYLAKENGECFHVKVYKDYLICGSKNVHGILRLSHLKQDLELYTDARFGFFRKMASMFIEHHLTEDFIVYSRMNPDQTFSGETIFLDNQHLVEYKENTIHFFAITSYTDSSTHGLVAVDPMEAYCLFTKLKLNAVTHVGIARTPENRDFIRSQFLENHNSEGAVVYVQTSFDRIRRIYKFKNPYYVAKRALREKIKAKSDNRVIEARLRALHVELPNLEEFIVQAKQFNAYCISKHSENWETISTQWVTIWNAFQKLSPCEKESYVVGYEKGKLDCRQLQLMAIAPMPGCGKTTLLQTLCKLFKGKYLDQDMFGSALPYHKAIQKASSNIHVPCVAMGKGNHTRRIRDASMKFLKVQNLVHLQWYHPRGMDPEMIDECKRRIQGRGNSHQTLFPSADLDTILHRFAEQYEPVDDSEVVVGIIQINMMNSLLDQVRIVQNNLLRFQMIKELFSDEEIVSAIQSVKMEEEALGKRLPKYWCIDLGNISKDLSEEINTLILPFPNLKIQLNHHVTLAYLRGMKSDEAKMWNSIFEPIEMTECKVTIVGMAMDEKASALKVEIEQLCANEHPHITLAIASGVEAVYSNELLSRGYIQMRHPLVLKGRVKRIV